MKITHITGRQILDSRGTPTVEADVWLDSGHFGRAAVPSGASTGIHEAHELRDGDEPYGGKGVLQAVGHINEAINAALTGHDPLDQSGIDQLLIELDGTDNKSRLGANAILAVSLATAHAAAQATDLLLYSHINNLAGNPVATMPMPMMNILNGGQHATDSTDIQEFMIIPKGATSIAAAVQMGAEVFAALKAQLHEAGVPTAVGDEGGFTLPVKNKNTEALDVLTQAITAAGYTPGKDVVFALDVAASEFFTDGAYHLKTEQRQLSPQEMIEYLQQLSHDYSIVSIEDGLDQDAWTDWQTLQQTVDLQLVGDDLLVTNPERVQRGIDEQAANAVLVKPNQIGTLSETIQTVQLAKQHGWNTIISHRSGETEDTTIAHIAIGLGAGQIKTGSLSRGERTAKYNELMRLAEIDLTLPFANPFAL
jgi:enolase